MECTYVPAVARTKMKSVTSPPAWKPQPIPDKVTRGKGKRKESEKREEKEGREKGDKEGREKREDERGLKVR